MEQINHVELRGNVGNIKIQEVSGNRVARISLATNYVYKSRDGSPVIETTWHNINVWQGRAIQNLDDIVRGSSIHVTGRIRSTKYTGPDGNEHQSYEVVAYKIELVDNTLSQAISL